MENKLLYVQRIRKDKIYPTDNIDNLRHQLIRIALDYIGYGRLRFEITKWEDQSIITKDQSKLLKSWINRKESSEIGNCQGKGYCVTVSEIDISKRLLNVLQQHFYPKPIKDVYINEITLIDESEIKKMRNVGKITHAEFIEIKRQIIQYIES